MRPILALSAIAVFITLSGCSDSATEDEPAAASTPSLTPSSTPSPKPIEARVYPVTGGTINITGYCYVDPDGDGNHDKVDFTTYEDMWAHGEKTTSCHLDGKLPPEYYQAYLDDVSYDAEKYGPLVGEEFATVLEAAYGIPEDEEDIAKQVGRVATMCAMPVKGSPSTNISDWNPAKELPTVEYLCSEHPRMAEWEQSLVGAAEHRADLEKTNKDREEGKLLYPGKYLVGTEAQPGRWETLAEKVTDCYWATLDAQGNIIANNFVSVAPRYEIYVPSTASSLDLSGCGMRWVGP